MADHQPHREGKVAYMLEEQTAKIPSDVYLWAAVGTMVLSLGLMFSKKKHASLFFGQWAPSLLIIGLYNKLVKVDGHDQQEKVQGQSKQATGQTDGQTTGQTAGQSAGAAYQRYE